MLPESRKYLWDVLQAAALIQEFVGGRNLDDYLGDVFLRSAVERQIQIIGEALAQLARRDPETAKTVPELPRVVAFRNILVHRYADVDDELVWGVLGTSLPAVRASLQCLLEES
jgi:uncharacterized protein with HEPN domain